jgi:hypothetical protein
MNDILLCSQATHIDKLRQQCALGEHSVTGLSCTNPQQVSA